MITGDEIREARHRAGLSQGQLGEAVGVSLRTIGNWERGATVPRNRQHALLAVLGDHLGDGGDQQQKLRGVSDVELLAEIARRFARGHEQEDVMGNAQHPAPTKTGDGPDNVSEIQHRYPNAEWEDVAARDETD